jgi:predicted Zn finger-like uncharacterized protein
MRSANMIVSCPSCTTRYDIGTHGGEGQFTVTCRACGHRWRELPVIDLEELPPIRSNLPAIIEHRSSDEPELDVQRLVEAARNAQEVFAQARKQRLRRLAGWGSLAACAVLPLMLAAWMPEAMVTAAPYSYKAYQKLGYEVNVYGLDIRRVEQQNRRIDDQHVLMVKGEISNPTSEIRKIPWLRFALVDASGRELYTWTLDTAARPLRPGETTSFTTRVAAPPELAKNLQIRFAHADEIGSNQGS